MTAYLLERAWVDGQVRDTVTAEEFALKKVKHSIKAAWAHIYMPSASLSACITPCVCYVKSFTPCCCKTKLDRN